ncbi:MAG: TIGR01440 family protein [Vagococcus sp.]
MTQLDTIKKELTTITLDVLEKAHVEKNDLFVLGCSSSEVVGGIIGKNSSEKVGDVIVSTLLSVLTPKGIHLAVQGCEHINRALTIEKEVALAHHLEIVSVVPSLYAGGSCATAAFKQMSHPVEVEHITAIAGLDIGDTSIGMHIKHVQIPIRPVLNKVGAAHVTALGSRPKLIGGQRALYQ